MITEVGRKITFRLSSGDSANQVILDEVGAMLNHTLDWAGVGIIQVVVSTCEGDGSREIEITRE